jgi:DNA-binding response OmpR family regulator
MLGRATLAGLRTVYAVDWVESAEDAQDAMSTTSYDLLVLDINLPGLSGLEWLTRLRKAQNDIPCLFLTARDATYHRVEGLNAGADDYLVKPFDLDELIARCAALLRRSQGRANPVIEHGGISYDPIAKRVTLDNKSVSLSGRELAILDYLLNNKGRILSKQQIEEHIYDWGNDDIGSNTIEVHISGLRRKLGRDLIKTIRNVGYTIE